MVMDYDQIRSMAEKLGYTKFTDLQQKAFEESEYYDFEKWLFVIGATGSGKTLIPLLYYFYKYELCKRDNTSFHMLFTVPYRALAGQKKEEISEMARKLELPLKVVQSTGEYRNDDVAIRQGKVDIAIIIYEKVFMFSSMDSCFLQRYQLLVMDEIGLTQDLNRGLKADFILAKARTISSLRAIALATPYYDWKCYIEAYRFVSVKEERRPNELEMYPIYYTDTGVNFVQKDCKAIQPFSFPPLGNGSYEVNPRQRMDYIIEKICQYHLTLKHKILIFENNREEVRRLAQRLFVSLTKCGSISQRITEKECRSYIGKSVNIGNDDELYGVMRDADYKAFASGIGYHNADIPTALRELIEKEILKEDGKLRIVCSTETLAYGINSNVDVVIIPHMMKQRNGEQKCSFLSFNEFMNYAGRAGRLRPNRDTVQEDLKGYVYPVLKGKYGAPKREIEGKESQQILWERLVSTSRSPQMICSCYDMVMPEKRAFYLLSLFPSVQGDAGEGKAVTAARLKEVLETIPCFSEKNVSTEVETQMCYLMERHLICRKEEFDDEEEEAYCLTDVGKNLAGYVIDIKTFDHLLEIVCDCITDTNLYLVDILKEIIETEEIRYHAEQNIGKLCSCHERQIEYTLKEIEKLFGRQGLKVSGRLESEQSYYIKQFKQWQKSKQYAKLAKNKDFCSMRLLAALLTWKTEHSAVKRLYDSFAIGYTQMRRFAEQVSYYLNIVCCALPVARTKKGEMLYGKIGGARIQQAKKELQELSEEIFYRVPSYICNFLNVQCDDPHMAPKLREVAEIYSFLEKQEHGEKVLSEKDKKQICRCVQKMENWPVEWKKTFMNRFGGILENEY